MDDNSDASRFRSRRVQCLFHLKRGLEAYRTVGPANDTFRQLAQMYDGEKDYTGLENLLTLHRLLGADDPEVPSGKRTCCTARPTTRARCGLRQVPQAG